MLCYEGRYKEAKKVYKDNIRCGKLPQLYFDEEKYISTSMPKWECVTWDEEITNIDRINYLITIQQHYLEFMLYDI